MFIILEWWECGCSTRQLVGQWSMCESNISKAIRRIGHVVSLTSLKYRGQEEWESTRKNTWESKVSTTGHNTLSFPVIKTRIHSIQSKISILSPPPVCQGMQMEILAKKKKRKMWVWYGRFHRQSGHQGSHMVRRMTKTRRLMSSVYNMGGSHCKAIVWCIRKKIIAWLEVFYQKWFKTNICYVWLLWANWQQHRRKYYSYGVEMMSHVIPIVCVGCWHKKLQIIEQ